MRELPNHEHVEHSLSKAPSFRSLPAEERRNIAHDMVVVMRAVGAGSPPRRGQVSLGELSNQSKRLAEVDFPEFVANLITGVFQAIVNATVQQVREYAGLVASLSKSVDEHAAQLADEQQSERVRQEIAMNFLRRFCQIYPCGPRS